MQGFQIQFFTEQGRTHAGQALGEWLLQAARGLGIGGATLTAASEGFGRDGKLRAAHFFELGEQPMQVTVAASAEHTQQLFALLQREGVQVFYIRTPVEFGTTGLGEN